MLAFRGIASVVRQAVGLIVLLNAAACTTSDAGPPSSAWFANSSVSDAGNFRFRSVLLSDERHGPLIVVIEGDGAAWQARGRPPRDPTPRRAIGLAVAQDLRSVGPVLYLGRPCQFLESLQYCSPLYWTRKRFAPEVLSAYRIRIDAVARGRQVIFVGYSGGGIIAAELALSHGRTKGLLTFAAPLDLARWTRHFDVTPLESPSGSGLLRRLGAAPWSQQHLFAARDQTVPRSVIAEIVSRLGPDQTTLVEDAAHSGPWDVAVRRAAERIISPEE